jgi:tetratricopeptide (TPR) repeat protein
MKSIKFLFVFAFMAISLFFANAQVVNNFNEMSFFKAKFTRVKVWDAQRSPLKPIAGQDWTLKGFKGALDASKIAIDWGTDRYLMLVAEVDNAKGVNSLADDINNKDTKYTISLKLFESNGTLVKVVSKWGKILGIGDKGFIYEVEGKYGSFFSVTDLNTTSVVTYKPSLALVSKLSEIVNTSDFINNFINKKDYDGAAKYLQDAIALKPEADLYVRLGEVYQQAGKPEDLIKKTFEEALKINPQSAKAYYYIGSLSFNHAVDLSNSASNIKDIKKYLEAKEKVKRYYAEALPYYKKALEIIPDNIEYMIPLRSIFYNLNMTKDLDAIDKKISELKKK